MAGIVMGAEAVIEQSSVQERGWGREIPGADTAWAPLSLRRNFSWTLVGNIVYAVCQWAILLVLAKLGSPEVVGRFALALAVTAPIFMFTNLQLRGVLATDATEEFRFEHYLRVRLLTTGVALLVVAGIVLGFGWSREAALLVVILAVAKACESISDVVYGLLQQREQMDRIAVSMILRGGAALVALAAAVAVTGSVVWGAVGLAATWALVLFTFDLASVDRSLGTSNRARPSHASGLQWIRRVRRRADASDALFPLIRLALPLGVVMMLISLNVNIPRYFIERSLGERELGIFAAIAYLLVAGTTVVEALGQSASPRLARAYANRDRDGYLRLVWGLIGIALLGGTVAILGALVAGRSLLTLLYSPEYARHNEVFVWLAAAAGIGFISSILGFAMTAARCFVVQVLLFAGVTVVTVIACAALIPSYGLPGAAIATVIAATCSLGGTGTVVALAIRRLTNEGRG
jgi:O-antigen/teichoic acid export membrane protein